MLQLQNGKNTNVWPVQHSVYKSGQKSHFDKYHDFLFKNMNCDPFFENDFLFENSDATFLVIFNHCDNDCLPNYRSFLKKKFRSSVRLIGHW